MSLIPRRSEMDAVIALLEDDSHEDAKSLARELIKTIASLLSERDTHGVGIGLPTDDMILPHGPYYGIAEANRVAKQARERGLRAFVAPLFSAASATPVEAVNAGPCETCGHVKEVHASFGCAIPTSKPQERSNRPKQTKCPCSGFSRKAAA